MGTEGKRLAAERRADRVRGLGERIADFLAARGGRPTLELGCGHGHWLLSLAGAEETGPCVGVDLRSRRIRLADAKRERRGLEDVLFLKAEAGETLEAWPRERPPARIFLLHPDPWPKKRHAKHRLTGPAFLNRMADATAPGAELYFRTDDEAFFEWSKEQIFAHPAWSPVSLAWPHEAASYFRDLLGVHGAITAVRSRSASFAGPACP